MTSTPYIVTLSLRASLKFANAQVTRRRVLCTSTEPVQYIDPFGGTVFLFDSESEKCSGRMTKKVRAIPGFFRLT
jgi:hypothetical protein